MPYLDFITWLRLSGWTALHLLCQDNVVHLHDGFGARKVQGVEKVATKLKHGNPAISKPE